MAEAAVARWPGRALFLLLLVTIGVLSLLPERRGADDGFIALDWNGAHLPAYLLLTLAALPARLGGAGRAGVWRAGGFTAGFGLLIEIIQPAFGRSFSPLDVALNLVGVGAAIGMGLHWRWYRSAGE